MKKLEANDRTFTRLTLTLLLRNFFFATTLYTVHAWFTNVIDYIYTSSVIAIRIGDVSRDRKLLTLKANRFNDLQHKAAHETGL